MAVQSASAVSPQPSARTPRWGRLALAVLLLIGVLIAGQVALLGWYPVSQGSFGASLGSDVGGCDGGARLDCTFVPFEPGHEIGIAFSVRNGGPIPITVEAVDPFGTDVPLALMTLEPRLPADPNIIGVEGSRPFAPITIDPGQEAALVLVGKVAECATVAGHWLPGSSMIVDQASFTARIGLLTRHETVKLQRSMEVGAPAEGDC